MVDFRHGNSPSGGSISRRDESGVQIGPAWGSYALIRAVIEWPERWSDHTIATAVRNAIVLNDLDPDDVCDVLDEFESQTPQEILASGD